MTELQQFSGPCVTQGCSLPLGLLKAVKAVGPFSWVCQRALVRYLEEGQQQSECGYHESQEWLTDQHLRYLDKTIRTGFQLAAWERWIKNAILSASSELQERRAAEG